MSSGPTPEQRSQMGAVGAATGLGCYVVVTLVVLIGGGALLDRELGTGPVLTLVGVALGLAGAAYELYELAQIGRKDRPAGPLGRRLLGAAPGRPGERAARGPRRDEEE